MRFDYEAVNDLTGEYVSDQAHTNGFESAWATLKRAHKGTFHHFSVKHLDRRMTEFAGRHNARDADTIEIVSDTAKKGEGKQLTYSVLADG